MESNDQRIPLYVKFRDGQLVPTAGSLIAFEVCRDIAIMSTSLASTSDIENKASKS